MYSKEKLSLSLSLILKWISPMQQMAAFPYGAVGKTRLHQFVWEGLVHYHHNLKHEST